MVFEKIPKILKVRPRIDVAAAKFELQDPCRRKGATEAAQGCEFMSFHENVYFKLRIIFSQSRGIVASAPAYVDR